MEGFEPTTLALQVRCSGQLSYIGVKPRFIRKTLAKNLGKCLMRWPRLSTLMPREIHYENGVHKTSFNVPKDETITSQCPYYRLTPWMVGTKCVYRLTIGVAL